MNIKNSKRFPYLAKSHLLAGLDEEKAFEILDLCRAIAVTQVTEILSQGEWADGIYLVAQGQIDISHIGPKGDRMFLGLARSGMVLGDVEILAQTVCLATCRAEPGSVVLCLAPQAFIDLTGDIGFVRGIGRAAVHRLERNIEIRMIDQFLPLAERVCAHLLDLADDDGILARNQNFLADTVGSSRQTVNRVLSDLRDQGLVNIHKGMIRIVDRTGMERRLS